ncbi:MAG: ATP-dependent DNA helicase [bacterium]|nr:ATP-dependent DNA helicase [bacterium]
MQKLNPKQREAVEAIEGPVMVVAGPGTGKTQILTLRVANILAKTDASPDAILALTFTEAAAANVRKRLVGLIGSRGYYVRIGTFHGFCNSLIQQYPDRYPAIIGGTHAMPADAMRIVRDIVERGAWEKLRPAADTYYYVPEILKSINGIKREGYDPDAFAKLVATERELFDARDDLRHAAGKYAGQMKGEAKKRLEKLERNSELADIYAAYQRTLRQRHLYDFDDMILETIKAMESDENFLRELQERYQYVLVDEHQDTNGAQNRVLELLASFYPNPNLFVVGDEKQAIFRFQGASLENFLYFKNKYPDARFINLEENYRSTQAILDSAQSLIEKNKAVLSFALRASARQGTDPIEVWKFGVPEGELLFLADRIKALADAGTPWNEIAVLYRENKDVRPIADFFAARQIPFVIESDRNVMDHPEILKFITLLEAIWRFGEDESLARALHVDFLELDPLDVYVLLKELPRGASGLYKLLARPGYIEKMDLGDPAKLRECYRRLSQWKVQSQNDEMASFIARVMRESGFLEMALQRDRYIGNMEVISVFFTEVKKISQNHPASRLDDLMEYLQVLRSHGSTLKERVVRVGGAVRLMTAHRAKGLEFEAVFIVGAHNGHWGNRLSRKYFELPFRTASDASEFEKNEDERRLFYMALTRAKRHVFITYSAMAEDGRECVPSQFIEEIRPELRQMHSGEGIEETLPQRRAEFLAAPASSPIPDTAYFAEIFRTRGLSATALNNYLSCPWKYFYQNLLRLPQVPTALQTYGTATHKALQIFFDAKAKGAIDAGKELLLESFRKELALHPLTSHDADALRIKGEKALGGYVDFWQAEWHTDTVNEFTVSGALLGDIKLTGKLDKLELNADGKSAVVVDYKTKQPQSRNWIEGKTKDKQSGDYKRQLVFYRLLLDLKPDKTYRMTAGVIDFVEPDDRGKYRKETFEIADAEKEELIDAIKRMAGEVVRLAFWDKRCDDAKCEYCSLRRLMRQ